MKTIIKSPQQLMQENQIVKHYAGSLAYGTNLPTSDVDLRGVFCADPINLLTPFFPVRECSDVTEEDTKLYELAHFMKLCLDCNPNIVETLWVDQTDIVYSTPAYELLRSHRKELLSAKIAFTTSGYAMSQLKRIKGHNKWINNPQTTEPPRQTDFVSLIQWFGTERVMPNDFDIVSRRDDYRLVPYGGNIFGLQYDYTSQGYQTYSDTYSLNVLFDGEREVLPPPLAIVKFRKDEYNLAKEKHANYWTWKKNRNVKRSSLEEHYGYDTKHAMHLVRLLRMGKEALEHGELIVKRPDAAELLDIRNGAWTYDEALAYAHTLDDAIRGTLYKQTQLPKRPNIKLAAWLLMEVQSKVWNK